jgi:WD40-like Beta Propeller Repeat
MRRSITDDAQDRILHGSDAVGVSAQKRRAPADLAPAAPGIACRSARVPRRRRSSQLDRQPARAAQPCLTPGPIDKARGRGLAFASSVLAAVVALAALSSACGAGSSSVHTAGLAFTRWDGQHASVWVARRDGSNARPVAAGAVAGMLSPDGRRLAYSLPQDEPSSGLAPLYVVELADGARRRIGEASGYAWSPDGRRLAMTNGKALVLVDARSGERHELARGRDLGALSFAPDGTSLAYEDANGEVGRKYRGDIFAIHLPDGEITRLTRDGRSDTPLLGRRWIVYRRFHFAGDWQIGRVRLMRFDGTAARPIARGNERTSRGEMGLLPIELSEDGTRLLACAAAEFSCSPIAFTLARGKEHRLSVMRERAMVVEARDLARDGTEVLVEAGAFDDVHRRIYAIPFAGGTPRLLVRDATSPSWAR